MYEEELVAEFVRRLGASDSDVIVDEARSAIEISRWHSVSLEPHVLLYIDAKSLRDHLESMREDAHEVFPSVEPIVAAIQLFLVHVDETIATNKSASELRLVGGRLRAR